MKNEKRSNKVYRDFNKEHNKEESLGHSVRNKKEREKLNRYKCELCENV